MTADETAVFTALATNKRGLQATGIATRLRWFRQSAIREFQRVPNEHRTLKALKGLMNKGVVLEHLSASGSRYKLNRT